MAVVLFVGHATIAPTPARMQPIAGRGPMAEYRVLPFMPNVQANEGAKGAAEKLQNLVNKHAEQGWRFQGLENVEMVVHCPGNAGCLGIGSTPATRDVTSYNMAVFTAE
jgi:hypothetical protein